jgi:hypothetical protein
MDSDLPEIPSSPPQLPAKNRKRPFVDAEFMSDGATFSSDPPEPALDSERRKRQHRGTWFAYGSNRSTSKSTLSRNFDSGIYLPSDSSGDSLPKSELGFEHTYKSRRVARPLEPEDPLEATAASIINAVVEVVDELVDLS